MASGRRAFLAWATATATSGCSGLAIVNDTVPTSGLRITTDIAYAEGNPRWALDLYRPDTVSAPPPLVVFFYGGSWQDGRRQDYLFVAAELARHGIMAAIADYRVFPEVQYPVFLEDGAAATRFCLGQATAWGADPSRVLLMGHSAGAYIAAMLAMDPQRLGPDRARLAGMVGLSGPYDFLPLTRPDIRAVFGAHQDDPATQPVAHVDGSNKPLFLLHGGADTTVEPRNSAALAARVRAAGGPVTLRIYPGIDHVGTITPFAPLLRGGSRLVQDVVAFLDDPRRGPA